MFKTHTTENEHQLLKVKDMVSAAGELSSVDMSSLHENIQSGLSIIKNRMDCVEDLLHTPPSIEAFLGDESKLAIVFKKTQTLTKLKSTIELLKQAAIDELRGVATELLKHAEETIEKAERCRSSPPLPSPSLPPHSVIHSSLTHSLSPFLQHGQFGR